MSMMGQLMKPKKTEITGKKHKGLKVNGPDVTLLKHT